MSHVIPGGRPRACSDGDILDEDLCGALLTGTQGSRSGARARAGKHRDTGNPKPSQYTTWRRNGESLSDKPADGQELSDACDSDGEISSQSQGSSLPSRRKRFSFKSVRKVVSRAFIREEVSKKHERFNKAKPIDLSRVWTPDLRYLTPEYSERTNGLEHRDSGTMSTDRPLITDPGLSMTMPKWKNTPGTVGIYNHANSCFMNAVLQCLSNTDSFTEYFIRDFYKGDLKNSKNGKKGISRSTHGEVTEQLGRLLKALWCGKYNSDISKDFKIIVGKYNSQYKGDHQHDSQEFLLWLLDRVHEDVSVFTKKKLKAPKNSNGKSDEELASEAASVNGESFVLKLFQALHSSTLTCPTCGEHSSTFDPYLCVSLPLPQKCPRIIYVVVVSMSLMEQKIAVTLNQFDGVRDLKEKVSIETDIPFSQLVLCQLKDDGFGATYSDEQLLSDIPENQLIYAMEMSLGESSLQVSEQEFDSATAQLLVVHTEVTGTSAHRFASPSVLRVRRDITWKGLQKEILYRMGDAVCEEILSQKLSNLFDLKVYEGSSHCTYLDSDVEMPLYTQAAERGLGTLNADFGPPHIKVIAEWDTHTKKRVVVMDKEEIDIHPSVKEAQTNPPGQGKVSLEECFKLYTQEEKLVGDDAWLCPHCKQQQQGTIKTLGLWSLPDVLVLHLKRFKQTGLRRSKLNTLVDFPIDDLDMSKHLVHQNIQNGLLKRDDYTYELLGVCNHYGNMMGGHYTAFCRSPIDAKWREFNDTKVTHLDAQIVTKDAYILFYQRRSLGKDINRKRFTGDHWVFSLPLALSDKIEECTTPTEGNSPRNQPSSPLSRGAYSRSVSPASRKKSSRGIRVPSRPLTPQPSRFTEIDYDKWDIDDSRPTSPPPGGNDRGRRSRPLHRQLSEVNHRRDKSGNSGGAYNSKFKESSKVEYFTEENSSLDSKIPTSRVGRSVGKSQTLPGKGKFSRPIDRSHHRDMFSDALESDDKYPESSDFLKKYSNRRDEHSSNLADSLERDRPLQVRLDDEQSRPVSGPGYSLASHMDSSDVYGAEGARRKLAQLMRDSSHNTVKLSRTAVTGKDSDSDEGLEDSIDTRGAPIRFNHLTSLDMARKQPLNFSDLSFVPQPHSTHFEDLRGTDSKTEPRGRALEDHRSVSSSARKYSGINDRSESYVLHSDADTEFLSSHRSNLTKQLSDDSHYDGFCQLARKHFGKEESPSPLAYDRDRYEESIRKELVYTNGDGPRMGKSATIAIAPGASRYLARKEALSMPRSNTDCNIQYHQSLSIPPPPSPTPPHSVMEEQNFHSIAIPSSVSDFYPDRHLSEIDSSSMNGYNHSERSVGDRDSVLSIRPTLPGYAYPSHARSRRFKPTPHRGIWGVKPKPQKTANFAPSACLRESSV
ncbi:ubiquitin carboxyl-terminal hydrolase 31 [Aplysia californica]|uniref:ubiquitinyl hydrolase 1 n=1 Tax=Aplysia californica TaxID=6500 RepID=A0ABM0JU89_APLCA|nr:ubiquitin carboxyl-terminal hydrolase 31 [Aplysia californica]